jgi:hypothetical protein
VLVNATIDGETRNTLSSVLQSAEQPSPSTLLPSSQASPGSSTPSPHGGVQSAGHPSPERVLPSSQASPGSSLPLPHVTRMQIRPSLVSAHCEPGGHTPRSPQLFDAGCRQPASEPITIAASVQLRQERCAGQRRGFTSVPGDTGARR